MNLIGIAVGSAAADWLFWKEGLQRLILSEIENLFPSTNVRERGASCGQCLGVVKMAAVEGYSARRSRSFPSTNVRERGASCRQCLGVVKMAAVEGYSARRSRSVPSTNVRERGASCGQCLGVVKMAAVEGYSARRSRSFPSTNVRERGASCGQCLGVGKMAAVEGYSARRGWYELPEDIREQILAALPVDCLCRSRSVCKEWNTLFSSTKFITTRWGQVPPNKKPWLFLCTLNSQMDGCSIESSAYCFFTRTWNTCISLSFLSQGDEKAKSVAYFSGSAQGLFLLDIPDGKYVVCNPLTGKFLKLPPMSSIKIRMTKGIVAWNVDNQETYKVVVVGLSRQSIVRIVEIYDSFQQSWVVAGHLPENLDDFGLSRGIVFSNGFFYYTTLHWTAGMGVLGFSITEGISIFTPLPELGHGNTMWTKLLTCGSRILLAGGRGQKRGSSPYTVRKIIDLILWEFDNDPKSSSSWKEIARMPSSLCQVFQRNSYFDSFECVGVGDCMCFTSGRCMDIAVYSLSEETWSWLPKPTTIDKWYGCPRIMTFKPRPDMKVG